jgi:hypothetical protein
MAIVWRKLLSRRARLPFFALGTVRAQPATKASKSLQIMMKSTQDELI